MVHVHRELVTNEWTEDDGNECKTQDVGINTDLLVIEQLERRIVVLEREREREREIKQLKEDSSNNQLSLESIADYDANVAFYTGSSSNVEAS